MHSLTFANPKGVRSCALPETEAERLGDVRRAKGKSGSGVGS